LLAGLICAAHVVKADPSLDIPIEIGDLLTVTGDDEGWFTGFSHRLLRSGSFPASYVEVVGDTEEMLPGDDAPGAAVAASGAEAEEGGFEEGFDDEDEEAAAVVSPSEKDVEAATRLSLYAGDIPDHLNDGGGTADGMSAPTHKVSDLQARRR